VPLMRTIAQAGNSVTGGHDVLKDSPDRDVENGKDGRVGKARRITFAVIDLTDNVQGEPSPHVIVVPESSAKKIVCAVEGAGHDAQGDGVIDLLAG